MFLRNLGTFILHSPRSNSQFAVITNYDGSSGTIVVSPTVSGGGPVSADVSLCLFHGQDSGKSFLCGHQCSGNQC